MRTLLIIYLLFFTDVASAQRPKAVQIFTITEYVSMFISPGEISIDKNSVVWFGSDNKLIAFDGFHYISYPLPADIRTYKDHSQLAFNYQDKSGKYWAFINNNGLYNFNPETKIFTPYPFTAFILQHIDLTKLTAKFLLEDSKGGLWISLNGYGLLCIEKTGKLSFYPVKDGSEYNYYISPSWLNKGVETAKGDIYFGTNQGLVTFDSQGKMIFYKDENPLFLPDARCIITGLVLSKDQQQIIMSTWGGGIKKFDITTKKFNSFLAQPQNNSGVINILNDIVRITDSTYFFVKRDSLGGTGFGIFNDKTNSFRLLKKLEPPYVTREYFTIVRDGNFIWVANINQLYRFYLPALQTNDPVTLNTTIPQGIWHPAPLYIHQFWVNENEKKLPVTGISLKNDENNLRFAFACKGATMYDSIVFSYRLKGYENNWHIGYGTTIQYNNIKYGDYTLEIKVNKNPFEGNAATLAVPISIAAKWWQTWWFKILLAMAISGMLIYAYRQRIRAIKDKAMLKNNYEKKIAEVEMKALRAQMNPHFIFNCLNSINKYIVKNDHVTASNYLTRFSKLIRRILDNSASGIITLETEIETLELYMQMEAMRFHDKFNYEVFIDPAIDTAKTLVPSMLVQPYIENAIWHGLLHKEDGNCILKLSFTKNIKGQLEIIIEDNGIGRKKAEAIKSKDAVKNVSQGMQITRDRLELIKSLYDITATAEIVDLYNESHIATGTKIIICLPLFTNHL